MGKTKKTRKFAVTKKIISPKDTRVKSNLEKAKKKSEEVSERAIKQRGEIDAVLASFRGVL